MNACTNFQCKLWHRELYWIFIGQNEEPIEVTVTVLWSHALLWTQVEVNRMLRPHTQYVQLHLISIIIHDVGIKKHVIEISSTSTQLYYNNKQ